MRRGELLDGLRGARAVVCDRVLLATAYRGHGPLARRALFVEQGGRFPSPPRRTVQGAALCPLCCSPKGHPEFVIC